ncbi:MAG: site-specific integrase [Lachnospiraceae bacterium]|nr:site-specific integrase [Lachnospiraceae bacterium]
MAKKYKYSTSFMHNGKRYSVKGNTKEEIYTKKANMIRDLRDNVIIYDSHVMVDLWAEQAFDTYKYSVQDLEWIKKRYMKYVSPFIRSKPIGAIKSSECQDILNHCAGMSYSHCNKLKQEMKFLFERAVDNQLIPFNPARSLKMPECTKGTRRSITETERKHFLQVYEQDHRFLLFMIILKCGCRPEEAINLIGKDIDHEQRLLHVHGTKSKNADRYVPIPDDLYPAIKDTKPFEPIAPNESGRKHTESSYKRLYFRLRREMNLSMGCKTYRNALVPPYPLAEDFVPYFFRHTYCTDLCKAGIDIRTAQRLMGHANISITAKIYTHVDLEEIKKAGRLLEEYAASRT